METNTNVPSTTTSEPTTKTLNVGKGKGGSKRHQKQRLQNNIEGITKPSIRRCARRGGVKRLSGDVYEESKSALSSFLETIIKDSIVYTNHAGRKTVTSGDIVYALKRN